VRIFNWAFKVRKLSAHDALYYCYRLPTVHLRFSISDDVLLASNPRVSIVRPALTLFFVNTVTNSERTEDDQRLQTGHAAFQFATVAFAFATYQTWRRRHAQHVFKIKYILNNVRLSVYTLPDSLAIARRHSRGAVLFYFPCRE
jgi:hypothetical protein